MVSARSIVAAGSTRSSRAASRQLRTPISPRWLWPPMRMARLILRSLPTRYGSPEITSYSGDSRAWCASISSE